MLLARVRRTIRDRRLLGRGDRVLVAVSGGPDSTAMLDVLARLAPELGIALEVASIDHGLRPDAAREVELARAQAGSLALPFHALALALPAGTGAPARARAARYEALRELASRTGARRIAVGHTLDDQAETVIARMLRGSGARGLAGIAPRRRDGVVRPLIDAARSEARSWCEAHSLPFAEDPSNLDRRFERARIRHELLPALAGESAAIVRHLGAIADDARALGALARRGARRLAAHGPGRTSDAIEAVPLLRAPEAVRREALGAWARALGGRPVGRAHLDALDAALQGRGEARLPGGWVATRVGEALHASRSASRIGETRTEPPYDPTDEEA